jgi:transcriptional regulator with XRE-family HTH domain
LLPAIQKGSKKMNVPTIDIVQTGANIKALRKAAGIKVKDVADTLGVSTQAVAKWQAGTALPTIDNLVILAAMLDTKIDDILVIA